MTDNGPNADARGDGVQPAGRTIPNKRSARLAAAALLTMLPFGIAGSRADAITAWRTFGTGTAAGLGPLGAGVVDTSSVYLDSVTLQNPARIRLVAKGPSVGRATIHWHMICGNSPTVGAETRRNTLKARLPHVIDLSDKLGGVDRWLICTLDAQVTYGQRGVIKLLLQARYE
jgi:hypothetical protein